VPPAFPPPPAAAATRAHRPRPSTPTRHRGQPRANSRPRGQLGSAQLTRRKAGYRREPSKFAKASNQTVPHAETGIGRWPGIDLAVGRPHSSATEQGRAHAPHPSAWPVFESISTQTRHRRLSTRHKERQAAPNRLLSPSPPSQALSKRFSRAPGPLRVVHRSPTSTGQAPVLWARTAGRSAIIVSPRRRQNGRCFSESTDATGSPLNSLTNEKSLI
jgi:hypothetical protein